VVDELEELYLPEVQLSHVLDPEVAWYVPDGHDTQLEDNDAPEIVEYCPASQLVHTEDPEKAEKVPAPQLEHTVAPAAE